MTPQEPHPAPEGDGDELRALLDALREETLTAEQGRRLEGLLRESDEALQTYIRAVAMQADLRGWLVGSVGLSGTDVPVDPAAASQDSMYGEPVCAVIGPTGDDEDEPQALPPLPPTPATSADAGWWGMAARTWAVVGGVAAVLVVGVGLWLHGSPARQAQMARVPTGLPASRPVMTHLPASEPSPPPVVATISASVDAAWAEAGGPTVGGGDLQAGSDLTLVRGFARLTFTTGVEVIVEAPARLTLASDRRVVLERGRLTAKVPAPARGFTVGTRRVEVVDLGTEFGVGVAGDGSVDVPVFTGEVQAHPVGGAGPVSVVAGQAGRVTDAGLAVRPVGPEAAAFVRDIRQIRGALPVYGTGQGLNVGDADPHWLLSTFPGDAAWKARAAVVCGPGPQGLANDEQSGWVSTAGDRPSLPGGLFTFATTFDLGRFDPATARLQLRLGVDNFVREVRLNGRPTPITLALPGAEAKVRLHGFDITEGFLPGRNELEVVVENSAGSGTKERPNAMALRVELAGTAVRQLDRR